MISSQTQRRLLLPVTVVGVLLLAFGGWLSSPPGTQLRIIHEIQRAGGSVGVHPTGRTGWWGKVEATLPYAFGQVHSVDLADVKARKHWLRAMRDWKNLRSVWLNRSGITDADLLSFADNKTIWELYLNGNPITELGLRNLGSKPHLVRLELSWTRVGQLESIKRNSPHLRRLKLRGAPVADDALRDLANLNSLHHLDLSRTTITDAGLKNLSRTRGLGLIELQGTRTTHQAARRLQAEIGCNYVSCSDGSLIEYLPRDRLKH